MPTSAPCTSLLMLPNELLSMIFFDYLPEPQPYGSNQTLLSASKTCKALRQVALPLLFETVCCHIRDEPNVHHHAFEKLVDDGLLLRHVKTLGVRIPRYVGNKAADQIFDESRIDLALAQRDLDTLKRGVVGMTHLRTVRYDGTLKHCLEMLECIPDQSIHVVLENVYHRSQERLCLPTDETLLRDFANALAGRHVSLGYLLNLVGDTGYSSFTDLLLTCMLRDDIVLASCSALHVENTAVTISSLKHISSLTELDLDAALYGTAWEASSQNLSLLDTYRSIQSVPWDRLLRLCVHDSAQIRRMRPFNLSLPSLRCLSIRPRGGVRHMLPYHSDCSREVRAASGPKSDRFHIDYSGLPALIDLELEGLCKHVRAEDFVAPTLRVLRIHAPHRLASTLSTFSQRSPSDVAKIAELAPNLTHLELDIGNIEKLWHPTAVLGLDIDMDIYNLLSTLTRFKSLHTLRLFPSYVARSLSAVMERHEDDFPLRPIHCQQPTTDPEAVAMFQRLRSQIPSLRELSILPSAYLYHYDPRELGSRYALRSNHPHGFCASSWHISILGDKTVLVTRQAGHNYSQRQIFVGQRRLTTSIQQHRYYTLYRGPSGGRLDGDSEWFLE